MKTFVVDDEQLSVDLLKTSINSYCPQLQVIGQSYELNHAYSEIIKLRPEVIFLDIEMPGGDSFELLEKLQGTYKFNTVFFSAHERYARQAVRAGAIDYLLKPLEYSELIRTVDKLVSIKGNSYSKTEVQSIDELERKIVLPHYRGYSLIKLRDIIDLEADNNYTVITVSDGRKIVCSQTLGKFDIGINSTWFVRVHRSHIINLYHLQDFLFADGGYAHMTSGKRISVSDGRVKVLKDMIDRYCTHLF